ncbi:putative glutamate synthase subunit beta [Marinomonas gallaica]|uniref:Glutamate synthase subunit beta n=1 Tax=Marinomonas gallaica TaxID=1806667 RepID=A0A1C3JMD8_9GAMM|nr:TIGR03862 family flavoprotein [Marinomonas gallaica]SBT16372.1 putative glutamate synthase subunit beta [Marinomonas gallaica]SBT21420.1 putative glutamate synthase subunit beta [Marinomonas gallaica]
MKQVIIIGAGPAGLMAAEVIQAAGHQVHIYDAMPSACRKFLLAGIGGMNITHSEPFEDFITRYYEKSQWLEPSIKAFNADTLRQWIHDLGIETFVGTSGRVFPEKMKAAPLLRNWLKRLKDAGVEFHMRHKLIELDGLNATFNYEGLDKTKSADAILLAMGGASWPKLGSDGKWASVLSRQGVDITPLESTNCGFYSRWSEHLQTNLAGAPLKGVSFTMALPNGQTMTQKGECIVTRDGMEGSLIYAFSKYLRDAINLRGEGHLSINLLPDLTHEQLEQKLSNTKPKESLAKYLKRTIKLDSIKSALLYETYKKEDFDTPVKLARCLQAIPVSFYKTKPIDEVISTAGGVSQTSVNQYFMIKRLPGVFCAGEMLDWEAPTGGYLLTACFATGRRAGEGVCRLFAE